MRRFLIAWAFLAASLLAALSGIPEKPHANLLQAPFTTGGPSLTSIARVGSTATDLGVQTGGASSYTFSYTVTSSTNTALVILETHQTGGGTVALNTVTYNAISCVRVGAVVSSSVTAAHAANAWFCPITGTTGAHNLVFTYAGAIGSVSGCVAEYTGVAQASATEGYNTVSNVSPVTTLTIPVTTAVANDWIIGFGNEFTATPHTAGSGFTDITPAGASGTCYDATEVAPLIDTNGAVAATTTNAAMTGSGAAALPFGLAFGLKHG